MFRLTSPIYMMIMQKILKKLLLPNLIWMLRMLKSLLQKQKITAVKTQSHLSIFYRFCRSITNTENRRISRLQNWTICCAIFRQWWWIYEPSVLEDFQKSIDLYLAQKENPTVLWEVFKVFKIPRSLKGQKDSSLPNGKRKKTKQGMRGGSCEIWKIWQSGHLGCHNPTSLLNTVWLNNAASFGWRAADEHKIVKLGDLKLKTVPNGVQYVEWEIERGTKTRNGGTHVKEIKFNPKFWATGAPKRCPVLACKM